MIKKIKIDGKTGYMYAAEKIQNKFGRISYCKLDIWKIIKNTTQHLVQVVE